MNRCVCNHAKRTHVKGTGECRGKYCLCPRYDDGNDLESSSFRVGFEDLIRVGAIKVSGTGTVKGS